LTEDSLGLQSPLFDPMSSRAPPLWSSWLCGRRRSSRPLRCCQIFSGWSAGPQTLANFLRIRGEFRQGTPEVGNRHSPVRENADRERVSALPRGNPDR